MLRLLALFVLVPAVELGLLIEIGSRIGTLATLGLIFFTGVLGAALARSQGLGVLRRIQTELGAGQLPADALLDGVLILLAGAVLMTPGVLTDLAGFLLLVPALRARLKSALRTRFERAVQSGRARVAFHVETEGPFEPDGARPRPPRVIDVQAETGDSGEPE